jgi:colanic acid/amylovoran biosynthesis glycosyltransferase
VRNLVLFPKALAVARYVRAHNVDHIHAHWLTTSSTIAYVASMMTGIRWSCTAHAHDIFSDNLLAEKVRSAAFVRAIADRNRRHLARLATIDPSDVRLIHLGVELPAFPRSVEDGQGPLQIACIARLDPIKGLDDLLASLAILRDRGSPFHCDIAGNGPLFEHLRATVANLALEPFVTLRGLVEHHTLLEELRDGRYDVLVLPSLELEGVGQHEGIPIALMEAMAAAVPCIATATGCIPELIDEQTGILVNQRDPEALASAFARVAQDRAFARELGRAARRRIDADFNVETTSRSLYDLICADTLREARGGGGHALPGPVTIPASTPAPHANCNAGKNASDASVTSSGSSFARPRKTSSA